MSVGMTVYKNMAKSFVSLDLPSELKVTGTEFYVIHIILIKTTQTCFWEGSFRNYTAISCTNNIDILTFISVMLLSATGQLWRDTN